MWVGASWFVGSCLLLFFWSRWWVLNFVLVHQCCSRVWLFSFIICFYLAIVISGCFGFSATFLLYCRKEGRKVEVYEAAMEWDSVENDTAELSYLYDEGTKDPILSCIIMLLLFFSRQDGERREGWFIVVWTLLAECTFICNGCVSKFRCGITKENIFIILHILVSQQAFVEIKLQGARF